MDKLLQHLSTCIRFQTVAGEQQNQEINRLYDWFKTKIRQNYQSEIIEHEGVSSLYVQPVQSTVCRLLLTAHIDVVTGQHTQFISYEKDGKLFGRGASDMKFAVAAYAQLIEEYADILAEHGVHILLTADEEVGGKNGMGWFVSLHKAQPSCVFLPDGGENETLVAAEKGVLWLAISSTGIAAHGSRPWEGKNAIDALLTQYHLLKEQFPDIHEPAWETTVTLTKIDGGQTMNQIPQEATLYLDIRFTEQYTQESIYARIKSIFDKEFTLKILAAGEHVLLDDTHPSVTLFKNIVEKHIAKPVAYSRDHGASDARYLTPYHIPVIMFKPIAGGHHAANEWIDLQSYERWYKILHEFIASFD